MVRNHEAPGLTHKADSRIVRVRKRYPFAVDILGGLCSPRGSSSRWEGKLFPNAEQGEFGNSSRADSFFLADKVR